MPTIETFPHDDFQNDNNKRNNVLAQVLNGGWSHLKITNIVRMEDAVDPEKGYWLATHD